jgi:hypothetical protein
MNRIQNPFLVLAAIVVIGLGVYGVMVHSQTEASTNSADAQKDAVALADAVGKLMVLPQGEVPIVATVSDLSKLQGQPFFAGAKVGDKVLIFNTAQKAVLYDPIANKIVNIAPIGINSSSTPH